MPLDEYGHCPDCGPEGCMHPDNHFIAALEGAEGAARLALMRNFTVEWWEEIDKNILAAIRALKPSKGGKR